MIVLDFGFGSGGKVPLLPDHRLRLSSLFLSLRGVEFWVCESRADPRSHLLLAMTYFLNSGLMKPTFNLSHFLFSGRKLGGLHFRPATRPAWRLEYQVGTGRFQLCNIGQEFGGRRMIAIDRHGSRSAIGHRTCSRHLHGAIILHGTPS